MPWWGWLLAGTGLGVAWMMALTVAGAWLGARLRRNREQEDH